MARRCYATFEIAHKEADEELGELKETVDRDELVVATILGLLMVSWFFTSVYWILAFEPQRTEAYAALGFDTTRRTTTGEYEESFRKAFPLFLIIGLGPVFVGLGVTFVCFAAFSGAYSRWRGADGSKVRQAVCAVIGDKGWLAWLRVLMLKVFDLSCGGKKKDKSGRS